MRALLLVGLCWLAVAAAGPFAASKLRVEYLPSPVSIALDTPTPRFSWAITHTDRAETQSAYQIHVTTMGGKIVWNSGKVSSSRHTLVAYAGNTLAGQTQYQFSVTWWDSKGVAAPSSLASLGRFELAVLAANVWDKSGSKWISSQSDTGNLYRHDFQLNSTTGVTITRARAYVAGLGWHEFRINGQKVGNEMLAPGWTRYTRTVLYMTYDVTPYLVNGANTAGVMLGWGWRDARPFPNQNHDTPLTDVRERMLRLFIEADFSDGRTNVVIERTNNHWHETSGPIIMDSVYNGETYDARREQVGWDRPKFTNQSSWMPVMVFDGNPIGGQLRAQAMPGIQTSVVYPLPASVTNPRRNLFVADFEQNFAGTCTIRIRNCDAGQKVVLRHAEFLNATDGQMIQTDNLRSAMATDTYICKGGSDVEIYTPRFTYHGFRFVEITGYPDFQASDLSAQHFHTLLPRRLQYKFSSSIIQRIMNAIVWGQESNLMSVPTDCDQRDERLGWMGDAALSSESFQLNFDGGSFWVNELRNMNDEQGEDGTLPDVVPYVRFGGRPADLGWGAAYPQTVWSMWKYEGDTQMLDLHFDSLMKYLGWIANATAKTGLGPGMYYEYGDWVPPPPAPACSGSYMGAYYYILGVQQVLELAQASGRSAAVAQLQTLLPKIIDEFNKWWFNEDAGSYDIGQQSTFSFALQVGAVPSEYRDQVATNLLADLENKVTHSTGGISGVKSMMSFLPDLSLGSKVAGRSSGEVSLHLLEQLDYPSWGYMMVNPYEPATTIWELMDAPMEGPDMNSRNHHMYSSVGQPIIERFAGIAQAPGTKGWSSIVFKPSSAEGLSAVTISMETQLGTVSSDWRKHGGVQCGKAAGGTDLVMDCGSLGGVIQSVDFASWGTPRSQCRLQGTYWCHSSQSVSIVSTFCKGRKSCTVPANSATFGEPCPDKGKWLSVQFRCSLPTTITAQVSVPVSSVAQVQFPYYSLTGLNIKEGGQPVFANSAYVPGVVGVNAAQLTTSSVVAVSIGSGDYSFTLTGTDGARICDYAREGQDISLTCPDHTTITFVSFASFGMNRATCNTTLNTADCHAGPSLAVVEASCLGRASCKVHASEHLFGIPCPGIKSLLVEAYCGKL